VRRNNGEYRLGAAALKLGTVIAQAISFPRCARPVLEMLAVQTGETVMLGVLSEQGHEVTYVDIIESDAALRFTVRVGNRRPLYATASGKVILAFQPDPVQQAYLTDTHFVRFTEETTDLAALAKLLSGVRGSGVVLDLNGFVDAASSIASPCFDETGRVFCSVSVAGPTGRIVARRAEFEQLTLAAGHEISQILGHQGPYPAA
jgi:DNA-binding IclR family transcriptional regulator